MNAFKKLLRTHPVDGPNLDRKTGDRGHMGGVRFGEVLRVLRQSIVSGASEAREGGRKQKGEGRQLIG